MTKEQFDAMKFSRRREYSLGDECGASWRIEKIPSGDNIHCTVCGTWIQHGHVPQCLKDVKVKGEDLR